MALYLELSFWALKTRPNCLPIRSGDCTAWDFTAWDFTARAFAKPSTGEFQLLLEKK